LRGKMAEDRGGRNGCGLRPRRRAGARSGDIRALKKAQRLHSIATNSSHEAPQHVSLLERTAPVISSRSTLWNDWAWA
jgi:hypothetical protein